MDKQIPPKTKKQIIIDNEYITNDNRKKNIEIIVKRSETDFESHFKSNINSGSHSPKLNRDFRNYTT
jgi:hypothetical protein